MAQSLSAVIYGVNSAPIASGAFPYQTLGFPTQGIIIRPADSGTVFNGVTMVTAIEVLPQGLNQAPRVFFSPTATDTIITAANA